MQIFDASRDISPYRMLLLVVLAVTLVAQMIAMAMLSESQVKKAHSYYAQQREARTAQGDAASARTAAPADPAVQQTAATPGASADAS